MQLSKSIKRWLLVVGLFWGGPGIVSATSLPLLQETPESFAGFCEQAQAEISQRLKSLEAPLQRPDKGNFLIPLNDLMRVLADAAKRANLYESVFPDESVRIAAEKCSQDLDALATDNSLSRPLFDTLTAIDTAGLSETERYLVKTLLRDFRLAGVDLAESKREQVKALQQDITKIGQDFSRTIREDVRYLELKSKERLAGLPEDYLDSHPADDQGVIKISTRYPDYIPLISYARDDQLRHEMFLLARSRGFPANKEHLEQLILKRHQLAQLLGFESYADRVTADKMIGSSGKAASFIDQVSKAAVPAARRDMAALLEALRSEQPDAEQVQRWQLSYLKNRIKSERYKVDNRALREYFAYGRVKQGVFKLVEDLFDVTFKPWQAPVWHNSVEAWEMWDGNALIGRFYLDMHPRDGKYQHAAMFPTETGVAGVQVPVATLVCNFPGESDASEKMEFGQVETFLHEFGHLLHELFAGHAPWVAQSGIATEWDFVEAPSQMLEEWVYQSKTLQSFAVNDAGEVLSTEVIERLQAARHFNQGVATQIQMFYAALSLNYYRLPPESFELAKLMAELEQQYSPLPPVPDTHFYANFGHLNGYSAIYYTYMWSQVIALDMFSRFEREGMLNKQTARDYREQVLAAGGSRPAAELVKNFLGREYSFDSFARRLNSR